MKQGIKAGFAIMMLGTVLFLTACPKRVSIGDIEANPSKYYDKEIVIAGTVRNSFGIGPLGGVYKVDDGTGSIWILSDKGVPTKGTEIGVKGKIQSGVTYGGKNYGLGMIENERKTAKR